MNFSGENKRSVASPKRSGLSPLFSPEIAAIDGGNDSKKNCWCIIKNTPGDCQGYERVMRRTPKKGNLSKKKNGEQKYIYALKNPEEYTVIKDKTIFELLSDSRLETIKTFKVEPDIGSYRKDRDEIIRAFRAAGKTLLFCDGKLTARKRVLYGIAKDEKDDVADASLILHASAPSFGIAKLSEEVVRLDRRLVKEQLERSEELEWGDSFSLGALETVSLKEIEDKFGYDLATSVFVVTAYAVALDPQVKNRRDFDRFCGLFARARNGKTGVGSVISSNLSHFNDSKQNRKASRYIYHKVCLIKRADVAPQRPGTSPLTDEENKRSYATPTRAEAPPLFSSEISNERPDSSLNRAAPSPSLEEVV